MKRVVMIVIVLLLWVCNPTFSYSPGLEIEDYPEQYKASVLLDIYVSEQHWEYKYNCNAAHVGNGYFLTARHCVHDDTLILEGIYASLDGRVIELKIEKYSISNNDLALLKYRKIKDRYFLKNYPKFNLADFDASPNSPLIYKGEVVEYIGEYDVDEEGNVHSYRYYPKHTIFFYQGVKEGADIFSFMGNQEAILQRVIFNTFEESGIRGVSGSPIWNENGDLVGILVAKTALDIPDALYVSVDIIHSDFKDYIQKF